MKILLSSIAVFGLLYLSASCKKGDQGEPGIPGNANVVQYHFGPADFTKGFVILDIPSTQDTVENSLWYVYLYAPPPNDRWYGIPGPGIGANSTYRVSVGWRNSKATIFIDRVGPGELYPKVRVIRVYVNNSVKIGANTSAHSRAGIDVSDFNAMRSFYHLP